MASKEREVIEEMIRQRDEAIEVNDGLILRLYKTYGINLPVGRRDELHAENAHLANECMLLDMVLQQADEMEVGE